MYTLTHAARIGSYSKIKKETNTRDSSSNSAHTHTHTVHIAHETTIGCLHTSNMDSIFFGHKIEICCFAGSHMANT